MPYTITRKKLDGMKKRFGAEKESDSEFLQWWRRNHGTGYENEIQIIERKEEI